jgi:hypothetical protein
MSYTGVVLKVDHTQRPGQLGEEIALLVIQGRAA